PDVIRLMTFPHDRKNPLRLVAYVPPDIPRSACDTVADIDKARGRNPGSYRLHQIVHITPRLPIAFDRLKLPATGRAWLNDHLVKRLL
ncbi:hypothetical protein, partial [Acidiferrobacter sp.]|uniref:hypothetical protein n=1 Tax=Acidiferrobacter sp. TaxID=1872107 RepID=UPI00261160BB